MQGVKWIIMLRHPVHAEEEEEEEEEEEKEKVIK